MRTSKYRKNWKETAWLFLGGALFFILVGLGAYIQVGVWDECRQDHSFFYCWKLMGK